MAAVTAPAPAASPRSPVKGAMHIKQLPAHSMSEESVEWPQRIAHLPPPPESPRLRQSPVSPVSPVRVEFQPEHWAQPANANIESDPQPYAFGQSHRDQDMPPPPPPHGARPKREDDNGGVARAPYHNASGSTSSTSQQHHSTASSAATSTSSVLEPGEAESAEGAAPVMVEPLHYHHQPFQGSPVPSPDLPGSGAATSRHLTPASNTVRHSSLARPQSTYSVLSGYSDGRGRSPASNRVSSGQSRRSPDVRASSYADMLNVPYPQPAPAPITLDNAQLRTSVGSNAALLSVQKTLDMYRQNVKKTTDMSIQYSFAVFLIATAQEQGLAQGDCDSGSPSMESAGGGGATTPMGLVREARSILQRLSNAGYPFAQYYLADGYASGLFGKGKPDYHAAFPLFVLAAKHGHAESAYRTALCYEFAWGCRKDPAKAVQYLRTAAAKRHPGAMTRLGKACLSGDLGETRYREGIKWLKLATESADGVYNAAPYQLGRLYETGYGDDIFRDEGYAAELFTQAAELGHADASFRMGEAYEHGRLQCPRDPALSVHFYTGAAERGHAGAMMGLCAWYMVGAPPLLDKDEAEAYEWARRAADLGLVKAQYAVGYFTEFGIGCRKDILEANVWYVQAADAGDERARQRLAAIRAAISGGLGDPGVGVPMEVGPPRTGAKITKAAKDEKDCIVM